MSPGRTATAGPKCEGRPDQELPRYGTAQSNSAAKSRSAAGDERALPPLHLALVLRGRGPDAAAERDLEEHLVRTREGSLESVDERVHRRGDASRHVAAGRDEEEDVGLPQVLRLLEVRRAVEESGLLLLEARPTLPGAPVLGLPRQPRLRDLGFLDREELRDTRPRPGGRREARALFGDPLLAVREVPLLAAQLHEAGARAATHRSWSAFFRWRCSRPIRMWTRRATVAMTSCSSVKSAASCRADDVDGVVGVVDEGAAPPRRSAARARSGRGRPEGRRRDRPADECRPESVGSQ